MRVGVVDIGSNSTRLLIAEVAGDDAVKEVERRSTVTRLGEGVDATGALSDAAMDRVRDVLAIYTRALDEHHAEVRVAVLTSAVRDASNGPAFVDEVRDRFGLDASVLAGDEEARLTFLGATSERDPADPTPTVVIDIGGGSTEFVVGRGRTATFHVSTQAGVVRQTERHIRSDPPAPSELQDLADDVRARFAEALPTDVRSAVARAIAVAGTATSLAAIHLELDPYDPEAVQGHVMELGRVEELLAALASMSLADRREVTGLHPDRAPTIVAGAILLIEALRAFSLEAFEVSEHDILRGAALSAVAAAR